MALLKQSTAYTRVFLMVLSSDHVSGATGKTVTVNLSKAGAAFGAAGGAVAEIANGWYKVSLNTTDSGTLGDLAYDCTASGCDNTDFCDQVIAVDFADTVRGGMTALPNVASGSAGAIPTTGVGSNQISVSSGLVSVTGDLTSTMKTSVENAVWDAARSSHVATGVFGQLGLGILRDNTATAGAAGTITLDAAASTTADFYKGAIIAIYSGTGAGQAPRTITAYSVGRVATVSPAWAVTPDATSKFLITAFDDPPFVGTDGRVLVSADSHTSGQTAAAVSGAVASVTADVGITQAGADKVWSTATRALTDKVGFALSSAGVQAIWDALTSVLTTVGSIGKLLVTNIDAAISSRSTYAGGDTSGTTTLLSRLTSGRATNLDNLDAAVSSRSTYAGGAVASVTAAVSLSANDSPVVHSGTAQAGGASTITLAAGASATDNLYNGQTIKTTGGTGPSQVRTIIGYVGSTKVATVDRAWVTNPDLTTTYAVLATDNPKLDSSLRTTDVNSANLDAAVSSRSTYAGADTSGTTTLLGRLTSTRAGLLDNLDAAVSSRSSHSAADVWAVGTRTLTAFTIAVDITAAGVSSIWDKLLTGITTASTIGKLIKDNLDAAISSRSTYAGGDTSGTTTLLSRLTGTRATNLDNLDTAVSTRSSHSAADVWAVGTRTLTAFTIAVDITAAAVSSIWDKLLTGITAAGSVGKLIKDNLDAAISSRSTYAGGDTSGTTTLLSRLTGTRATNLDNLDTAVSTRSSHSAADVWAVGTRTLTAFTIAVDITAAAVSSIWDKLLTGITAAGSVGKLIKDNLDAAISSRSTYAGGDTSGTTTLLSRLSSTRAGNLDNLDAAISSRSVFDAGADTVTVGANNDKSGYALSATGVDDIWDEATSGHTAAGTTGKALTDAGASGSDPWDALLPGSYAPGSAGDIVGNNLDAAVSSRSSHSAADVWSVGTRTLTAFTIAVDITSAAVSSIWDKLLTGITAAGSVGKLIKDNLDAAISSRSTYAGGDTSGTTTLLSRLSSTRAGNLDNLDAAISTRLASADYTAPDNADVLLIKAKTDQLNFTGTDVKATLDGETVTAASVTDKTGYALTSGYDPAKTAAQAGDAMTLTSSERNSVADALLKRDWTAVSGEAARSVLNALRFLRNKWSFSQNTLTVTKEDDATPAWTATTTQDGSVEPIVSVDPS